MFSVALSVSEVYDRSSGIPLRPSLLASTLPCGVRTFLSPAPAGPSEDGRQGRAAIARLARVEFMIVSCEGRVKRQASRIIRPG
jgi:hypothetical protein